MWLRGRDELRRERGLRDGLVRKRKRRMGWRGWKLGLGRRGRERGSEVGKERNRVVGRNTAEVGEGEGTLSLRKSKRKRPEKDVDGEESEEEEVVKEVEMVMRRMMRKAVGKSQLEEYADGNNHCAGSGKGPMDLSQAESECGQKVNEGKGLTGLLKGKLSADLVAKIMSDSESE